MSSDFDPFTKFDPNAWYYLSESRVDNYTNSEFTSNFHTTTESRLEVSGKREKQMWQFHPVDEDKNPGRYYARLNYFGPWKQLSVCQVSGEKSVGNTWPCMMDSEPKAESQMWDVQLWGGDEEYLRLVNVANGTENWLDVHKGNPVYMRSEKDEDNDNLGDRWLYTSVGRVNDEKYSTVFNAAAAVDSPQTTDGSAPPSGTPNSGDDSNTSEDSDSGLSAGATAGIGAGVGLAVVFLGVLIFWLLRRRKNTANRGVELSSGSPMAAGSAPDKGVYAGSMPHSQNTAANSHGWDHSTQSASPPQGQQNAYYPQQGGAYTQINGPYQAGTGNENRPHELGGAAPAEMPSDRY